MISTLGVVRNDFTHRHQREATHSRESGCVMVSYNTSEELIRFGYIQS
jgi:hypothetical protein